MRRYNIMSRLWVVAVALGLAACGQDSGPLGPTDLASTPGGDLVFAKKTDGGGGGKGGGKGGPKDGGGDTTQTLGVYAEQVVGKNGGVLRVMGAELSIPKGAVSSRTLITMEDVGAIEGAFWAYEFTPSGLTFKKPAELEVDVSLEFLQANGIDPGRLRIALVTDSDPASWQYLDGRYQPADQQIKAKIDHFSRYALCIE
jgi:hypothetical protein